MNAHIRDAFPEQNDAQDHAEWLRRFRAGIFAGGIENARKGTSLSLEDTAELAGMEISEWIALEAGRWLPRSTRQLTAIARALGMSYDRLAGFVLLCRSAWERSTPTNCR